LKSLLSKVVRTILAIRASNAKPERDFSIVGFIKRQHRYSLATEKF
jgi:hypothetical protein